MKMKIGTFIALMLSLLSNVSLAAILGGSIDTQRASITLIEDLGYGKGVMVSISNPTTKHRMGGRMFLVYPSGYIKTTTTSFRDRYGTYIEAPLGTQDKVIFIDNLGYIKGGVGLTPNDISQLASYHRYTFARASAIYTVATQMRKEKMNAIKRSLAAFDTDTSTDEQVSLFKVSIQMQVGSQFANLIDEVIKCAATDEEASYIGRAVSTMGALARGVFLISYGDNGGFDTVAYGDNGGFDTRGTVSYGDNGGFDIVTMCGDDGRGCEALIQGWKIDPQIPALPNTPLNLNGIMMMIVE